MESIYECRTCYRCLRADLELTPAAEHDWYELVNIDGPHLMCPRCAGDPGSLTSLSHEYPNVAFDPATSPVRLAMRLVNNILSFDGCITVKGDFLKGITPDLDEGGTGKCYIDVAAAQALADAFTVLASELARAK